MRFAVILPALLSASAALAQASPGATIILSDRYGRPMTVGSQDDARDALQSGALSGVAAADAFHALCLAGGFKPEAFAQAAQAPALKLQAQKVELEPIGKTPAYAQDRFVAPGIVASWWDGNEVGLKNRAIGIRDRGAVVASGYGPFKAVGRQCNVSMKLAQAGDLQAMADRIGAITLGTPEKIVVKPKWADGSWMIPNSTLRVSFAIVDADKPAALVHFTVQDIEGAKP
ncbi:MAG: hypothetical protein CFE37_05505 [Alphaproteobacteria bacterium PA4]|nr:MAG: hypothetical protein CFE37_05505 [Alphaproteobacteria bacterium PA4]